jgi:hypothetical protein
VSIVADIAAIKQLIDDATAIESGPVEVKISAPVHITITASNGKTILDTTVNVNV